jgi:formate/nitrite transporter FocA (FNT family)
MATERDKQLRKAAERREVAEARPTTLDLPEQRKAEEEQKLDAAVTHEVIRREGLRELNRSPAALAWSGLAAGLAMGLSLVVMSALHQALPASPWRSIVVAIGYPIGFLVVTLGSQQLYTENTLRPVVPLMTTRTREMLRKVLVLWGVVLLANLAGALVFGWASARTLIFPAELRDAMRAVAFEGVGHPWLEVFASGVAAGWVIALMVWMLPAASTAQVAVVTLMTWTVGAAGLSHVIVGSVEAFHLLALGEVGFGAALGGYVLPALLGNTLGGVALVAALNHAQVEP